MCQRFELIIFKRILSSSETVSNLKKLIKTFRTKLKKAVSHSCQLRAAPRLRAAPLFAFCLLRRGMSGHSRNAPLSIVCFMSFFGMCVFIRVLKRWCASSVSPPTAWQTFQTTVSTSHCVRKELTATLCVRVWSWYDIAIKLQFFILFTQCCGMYLTFHAASKVSESPESR